MHSSRLRDGWRGTHGGRVETRAGFGGQLLRNSIAGRIRATKGTGYRLEDAVERDTGKGHDKWWFQLSLVLHGLMIPSFPPSEVIRGGSGSGR
jgi:hypothetical protein